MLHIEKQKYTKEDWITRWMRSRMVKDSERVKQHEYLYQYCMDRYLLHVVGKQLGKTGGTGFDQNHFAGSDRYQKINANAQQLLQDRMNSGTFTLAKQ